MKKRKRSKSRKGIITALTVLLLLVGGVLAYNRLALNTTDESSTGAGDQSSGNSLTDAEEQELKRHKDELAQKPEPPTDGNTSGQKKQVSVIITHASDSSINAYVSDVLEDNGTCTATLVKGSQKVTRTSAGFSNVSNTNCTPITPNFPSSGSWSVTVSYSSPTSEGKTQTTVEVP